jgi:hypothetical protein
MLYGVDAEDSLTDEHRKAPRYCFMGQTEIVERKKNGMRCLMIELRETEINALIAKKLLKGEMRNDISAIIDALYLFLEQELDRSQ